MTAHIIERAIIHLFSGGTAYLLAYFACRYCERKFPRWWSLIYPAIMGFGIIGLRESYDVAQGQAFVKVITDGLSWLIGLGLAVWGVHRIWRGR